MADKNRTLRDADELRMLHDRLKHRLDALSPFMPKPEKFPDAHPTRWKKTGSSPLVRGKPGKPGRVSPDNRSK